MHIVIDCGRSLGLRGPIQSVEVTYLLHATEDGEKVNAKVRELVIAEEPPEVEEMEGHFGNKISRVRFHLTGESASRAFESMAARFPGEFRSRLESELDAHLDEHSALFFRLDKQLLMRGTFELGTADPVRVKVKPRGYMVKGDPKEFYLALLSGGSGSG
jgi:RNA binding exosome subunit